MKRWPKIGFLAINLLALIVLLVALLLTFIPSSKPAVALTVPIELGKSRIGSMLTSMGNCIVQEENPFGGEKYFAFNVISGQKVEIPVRGITGGWGFSNDDHLVGCLCNAHPKDPGTPSVQVFRTSTGEPYWEISLPKEPVSTYEISPHSCYVLTKTSITEFFNKTANSHTYPWDPVNGEIRGCCYDDQEESLYVLVFEDRLYRVKKGIIHELPLSQMFGRPVGLKSVHYNRWLNKMLVLAIDQSQEQMREGVIQIQDAPGEDRLLLALMPGNSLHGPMSWDAISSREFFTAQVLQTGQRSWTSILIEGDVRVRIYNPTEHQSFVLNGQITPPTLVLNRWLVTTNFMGDNARIFDFSHYFKAEASQPPITLRCLLMLAMILISWNLLATSRNRSSI